MPTKFEMYLPARLPACLPSLRVWDSSRLSCRSLAALAGCKLLYLSVDYRSAPLMLDLDLYCTVTVLEY